MGCAALTPQGLIEVLSSNLHHKFLHVVLLKFSLHRLCLNNMHRLFGKPKPKVEEGPPPPSLSDTTESMNTRIKELDKKIKDLDAELVRLGDAIKKAPAKSTKDNLKRRAMDTLKRKRMFEKQRDQLAGQAFNIEQTIFTLESIKETQTTVAAMKDAAKQLKIENKKLDIDEIEDMQDDLQDLFEDIGEITEGLSRNYNIPDGCDEEDLEAELAMLSDELESEEIGASSFLSDPSSLPKNPQTIYPSTPSIPVSTDTEIATDKYGLPL